MVFEPFLTEIRHNCASRSGLEYAFCTIKSRGTEIIVLGCKLHSGTSKTKELVPVQRGFPLF